MSQPRYCVLDRQTGQEMEIMDFIAQHSEGRQALTERGMKAGDEGELEKLFGVEDKPAAEKCDLCGYEHSTSLHMAIKEAGRQLIEARDELKHHKRRVEELVKERDALRVANRRGYKLLVRRNAEYFELLRERDALKEELAKYYNAYLEALGEAYGREATIGELEQVQAEHAALVKWLTDLAVVDADLQTLIAGKVSEIRATQAANEDIPF